MSHSYIKNRMRFGAFLFCVFCSGFIAGAIVDLPRVKSAAMAPIHYMGAKLGAGVRVQQRIWDAERPTEAQRKLGWQETVEGEQVRP